MSWLVNLFGKLLEVCYDITEAIGIPGYGWAIILFTIIVRVLLLPLAIKQGKVTKIQSMIAPRVQQLQEQYKNNPEILNKEMSALYKKYNANPASGCLPLLIQLPLLWALFSCLRNYEFIKPITSFLWISDLSVPAGDWIMPIIVAVSSFLQTALTMKGQPPTAGDTAKAMNVTMKYAMPLMVGWISRSMPAGLAIYWAAYNIIGVGQQYLVNNIAAKSASKLEDEIKDDNLRAEIEKAQKAKEKAAQKEEARKRREAERLNAPKASSNKKKDNAPDRGKPLNFD